MLTALNGSGGMLLSWLKPIIVVLVLITLIVVCVPFVGVSLEEHALSKTCADHRSVTTRLTVIRYALDSYADSHGSIPPGVIQSPAGEILYSWRVALGADVEDIPEWRSFAPLESWNSLSNSEFRTSVAGLSMGFGYCDSDAAKFLGVTGNDTVFGGGRFRRLNDMPASLIVIIEVPDWRLSWMEPGDFNVDLHEAGDAALFNLSGPGFHILFADGAIWRVSSRTPKSLLFDCMRVSKTSEARRATLHMYRIQ